MASVDAAQGAAFDGLINALDRQTKCLRRVLDGKERFKLAKWQEWSRANVLLERLVLLKIKASRRSYAPPSESKTSGADSTVTATEAQHQFIELLKSSERVASWAKYCLYRAGCQEAMGLIDAIPSASLVAQLVASHELRQRVMDAVVAAQEHCESGYQEEQRLAVEQRLQNMDQSLKEEL